MSPGAVVKWRGISTNPTPRFELEAMTVLNPWRQKTIRLPRIDDKKRWAGYPGNTGISRKLARLIPKCGIYVEPFAGTAKVFQELFKLDPHAANEFVLNDKSQFVAKWLRKEFNHKDVTVTKQDFINCMKKWDSKRTIFVIDHPWFKSYYDQIFSCFDRENTAAYDNQLIDLCRTLKGKFFISTRKENMRMRNSGFKNLLIKSEYCVSGKYPEVLITTNISGADLE